MSQDPADREVGPGRSEGSAAARAGLAAAFVANTVDDGPPGLEPTLGSLRRALEEIEGALAATGSVRTALVELAAGSPGDDRVLLSFLRTRLAGPDGRLLEILAGISEEHRALLRAEAEILAIYERPYREPILALERLAAATAPYRTRPIATYVEPRPKAPEGGRGPLGAIGSLVGGRDGSAAPGRPAARPADGATRSEERGSSFGWLSGLLRPPARTRARVEEPEVPATPAWTPVASDGPVVADVSSTPIPAGTDLDDLPLEAHRGVPIEVEPAPPAFLDVAPAGVPEATAPAPVEIEEEPAEASRASAIALPTATADYGTRSSSRPRPARPKPRSAGSGGRRMVGVGLAIVIPAAAAMWMSGIRSTDTATAGDASGVAAVTSPATTDAAVAASPLTVKDSPDVIPLGDDHGTAAGPIGTEAPAMANILPIVPETETAEGVTLAYTGPTDRKVIALTFDDGYAPPNTRTIFEMLVRENVKATFFVNGYYLSRDPALWKEIADAGFPVGNHTYYHVDVRTLDAAAIKQELRMTSSAWKRVTGGRMIPYFRPPYGARTVETDAAVAAAGYKHIVMWDTSSADTKPGISDTAATASALSGGPGSIVLLHAGPDVTPRILKAVIDGYRSRGFEFVTIPELLGS